MSSRTLRTCIHQTADSSELDLILANCEAHRLSLLPTGGNTGNAGPELGKPLGGSSTCLVPMCGVLAETVNSLPPIREQYWLTMRARIAPSQFMRFNTYC